MNSKNKDATSVQTNSPFADKKQWLFMLLFVTIAGLSVWLVMLQSSEFSVSDFKIYVKSASIPWLGVALLSMLGFIFFEAFALLTLCRAMGCRSSLWKGYIYSASDIFFSAITPSATGGQPASAYFMIKDGINGMMSTAILIANLCMYTAAIIVIGFVCLIFRFDIFLQYSIPSKILIIAGFITQIALLCFFFMLLKHERLLHKICDSVLRLLCKMRILKNKEAKQAKLDAYMEKYREHSKLISNHPGAMFGCFFFNLMQRIAQVAVTMFVYMAAMGKSILEAVDLLFYQGYVTLGANCIPIPGAMGVSDYMMLDGFENIMAKEQAVNLELLARSFSFYSCVIICGISVFVQYCIVKRRRKLK